uniref:Uncharacterized protein n=1 Tax=uncultured prokaryote TaxID=198431 RepID=A0A0H5Q6X6_9ZZZZ|nr:hypothetical protein [uncultured prokaryote]
MRFTHDFEFDPVVDDSSSIGADIKFIKANSIWFPDASTGSSVCAFGYKQWGKFYGSWVVLSSHITCSFISITNGVVTAGPALISVDVCSTQSDIDLERMIEAGKMKWRMLQMNTNGNVIRAITSKYDAKSYHSVADVADADNLAALYDATYDPPLDDADRIARCNPKKHAYYRIAVGANVSAQDVGPICVRFVVTYDVLQKDPRTLTRTTLVRPVATGIEVDPDDPIDAVDNEQEAENKSDVPADIDVDADS